MAHSQSASYVGVLALRINDPAFTKGERTRATIRWATAAMLEDTGYASFSLEGVAARAEVSRPTIYQYYANKRDCVFDVLSEFLTVVFQFVERDGKARRAKTDDLLTVVTRTNREYIAFYRENATLVERVRELRQDIPELIAVQQGVNQKWAGRLASHICKNGPLSARQALFTAYALESMIDDFLRELFVLKNPHLAALNLSDDALAQSLSEVWVRAAYGYSALNDAPAGPFR
jgi:AcrR family transcriptional regulator